MMGSKRSIISKLTDSASLSLDAMPRLPLIEIAGQRRVLIENHMGVIEYGSEQIRIKVSYGTVSVCGYNLELARMIKEQLVITGQIHKVELHKGGA